MFPGEVPERISTYACRRPFVLHASACTSGETDRDARQSGCPVCSAVPASLPSFCRSLFRLHRPSRRAPTRLINHSTRVCWISLDSRFFCRYRFAIVEGGKWKKSTCIPISRETWFKTSLCLQIVSGRW